MIRDEFKNQRQKKKLTEKDMSKIREMGERAYYTSSIAKMKNSLKSMRFLLVFALIFAIIITITMVVILSYYKGFNGNNASIISFVVGVFLWLFILGWLFIFKPYYQKRIELFSNYVQELTDKEMAKQQAIYNKFKKQNTENSSGKGE